MWFLRYQKVSGHYTWVVRKSVQAKGSVLSASATSFKASQSLPYTGWWRVIAIYHGAPIYADATSSARSFTVY